MPLLTGIVPTTELEAVNTMLSAIGEAPVLQAQIDTPTAADLVMAINILRNTTRETLSMGWRFNMEFGYELEPTSPSSIPMVWNLRDNSPDLSLNIFVPPANLARFRVSRDIGQIGSRWVDVVVRPPRRLDIATYPLVFYDRANNRDGLDSTIYPVLYIDPVWFFDFNSLPESARRYIAIRAARQLTQQAVGAQELAAFTEKDELYALRVLKREHGDEDDHCNMFDYNMDTASMLGNRTRYLTGILDPRSNVGPGAPLT
jgi:hypothetical protein